jgi:hypothetical protein
MSRPMGGLKVHHVVISGRIKGQPKRFVPVYVRHRAVPKGEAK